MIERAVVRFHLFLSLRDGNVRRRYAREVRLLGLSCQNPALVVVCLRVQRLGFRSHDNICGVRALFRPSSNLLQHRRVDRDLFERRYHHTGLVVREPRAFLTAKKVCWQRMARRLVLYRLVVVDKVSVFVFVINGQSNVRLFFTFRFIKRLKDGSKIKTRNRLIIILNLCIIGSRDVFRCIFDEMSSPRNPFESTRGRDMLTKGQLVINCLWEGSTLDHPVRILG